MLLQTNSYIVPKDKRAEHARLMRRFRDVMQHLGCTRFEVLEQVGSNWARGDASGRFVQMMAFRDRDHQRQIQQAESTDPSAQRLVEEFCKLVNYPYQQQQGLFASGFYANALDGGLVDGGLVDERALPAVEVGEEVSEQPTPGEVISDDAVSDEAVSIEEIEHRSDDDLTDAKE